MARNARLFVAFLILFAAYQLPEGLGMHVFQSFPLQAGLMLLFFPVAFLVARFLPGESGYGAYSMGLHAGWLRLLFLTLALSLLVRGTFFLIGVEVDVYRVDDEYAFTWSLLPGIAWFTFSSFFPAAAEDIVTRGFFYRRVNWTGLGARFAVVSAVIYVFNHVYRLDNGPVEWAMLLAYGLAYGAAIARTGSLWAAIGFHWGANIAGFAFGSALAVTASGGWQAPALSAAAHLAMAAMVFVLPADGLRRTSPASASAN